jgi:hypothetical protein
MKKRVLNLLIFLLFISISTFGQGGASSCAELAANPSAYQSCATNIPFSSSVGGNGENFNSTCIPTQYVGPTWFFIEIDTPGNVVLQISQRNLAGNGTVEVSIMSFLRLRSAYVPLVIAYRSLTDRLPIAY